MTTFDPVAHVINALCADPNISPAFKQGLQMSLSRPMHPPTRAERRLFYLFAENGDCIGSTEAANLGDAIAVFAANREIPDYVEAEIDGDDTFVIGTERFRVVAEELG